MLSCWKAIGTVHISRLNTRNFALWPQSVCTHFVQFFTINSNYFFKHLSRLALGSTQPPVQWLPALSRGVRCGRGVTLTPYPLLVPKSEIYYSYTSTLPKGLRGIWKGETYLHKYHMIQSHTLRFAALCGMDNGGMFCRSWIVTSNYNNYGRRAFVTNLVVT
jgi:hypothetical protein